MRWYWGILSVALPSKKDAYEFRRVMYKENGISRHKMKVAHIKHKETTGWRVFRKIHEHELADPLLGNEERRAEYRRYLQVQTRKAERWLKGRKL